MPDAPPPPLPERLHAATGGPLAVVVWAVAVWASRSAFEGPAAVLGQTPAAPPLATALVAICTALVALHVGLSFRAGSLLPPPAPATSAPASAIARDPAFISRVGAGGLALASGAALLALVGPWAFASGTTATLWARAQDAVGGALPAGLVCLGAAGTGLYIVESLARDAKRLGIDSDRARRLLTLASILIAFTLFGMTVDVLRLFTAGAPLFS